MGADPMGGAPMGGASMGAPPMGAPPMGMDMGMGGGMGGMGGPPAMGPQEPPIPKTYNVWDVLEAILSGQKLPDQKQPAVKPTPPEQQLDLAPPDMGPIPGMGTPMGGGLDQMGGGMGGPFGGGGPHLMG
jgi:hypothetical protein